MHSLIKYALILLAVIIPLTFLYFMNQEKSTPTEKVFEGKETLKIVAFGDSLTEGYGVSNEDSYPSKLAKRLEEEGYNITIVNLGISGETTAEGLLRIDSVLAEKPDIVLLGLGANDMLRGMSVENTKNNLTTIIQRLQENDIKIVLVGMKATIAYGLSYKREFDAIYKNLSETYNLPLVPFFLEDVALVSKYNISDGLHPNKEGYDLIVNNNILPVILPYLKGVWK